ncbi:MAG: divergent polysaccharide deacetylase family protein, partial [Rhodospirillaceae bacterium]|nr:divergent polysaccharide deacetylase family protein [Rhodospirillaceae bacterium]
NDPGPHTLLTSLTINRNLKRLDWLLGRFTGYVGVVNYMGGRFTSAESHLAPILEAMRGRGLMFLDARASSASVAVDVADKLGLDVAASDRIVDVTASRAAIDARLLELERLASATGGAIGIGFPYPVTIERLAQWTRAMGDRGFDLVPVSALAGKGPAKP